jgi:hypothetical protein
MRYARDTEQEGTVVSTDEGGRKVEVALLTDSRSDAEGRLIRRAPHGREDRRMSRVT